MEAGLVTHEFDAFFDKDSRVLILGTIPSPKSREQGFYYGHPQNRFWKVLADVLGEAFEEHSTYSSSVFLEHLIMHFPMPIECVQTDNGH